MIFQVANKYPPVAESGEENDELARLFDMVEFSDPQKLTGDHRLCCMFCGLAPRTEIFRCRFAAKNAARYEAG